MFGMSRASLVNVKPSFAVRYRLQMAASLSLFSGRNAGQLFRSILRQALLRLVALFHLRRTRLFSLFQGCTLLWPSGLEITQLKLLLFQEAVRSSEANVASVISRSHTLGWISQGCAQGAIAAKPRVNM